MRNLSPVDLVTETMRRVTAQGFDPQRASWDHRVCVLVHAMQGIVDNGGFEYFFESHFMGGPNMEDFPQVFEAVGAHESAAAVREALRRVHSQPGRYDDLNSVLWRESDRNFILLAEYIAAHPSGYA